MGGGGGTRGQPLNPATGTGAGLENDWPSIGCRAELQPVTVSPECLAQLQRETSRCGGAACSKRAGKGGEPPCLSIWLADSRLAARAPQEQRFAFRAEEGGGEQHNPSCSLPWSRGVRAAHEAEGHGGGLQWGSAVGFCFPLGGSSCCQLRAAPGTAMEPMLCCHPAPPSKLPQLCATGMANLTPSPSLTLSNSAMPTAPLHTAPLGGAQQATNPLGNGFGRGPSCFWEASSPSQRLCSPTPRCCQPMGAPLGTCAARKGIPARAGGGSSAPGSPAALRPRSGQGYPVLCRRRAGERRGDPRYGEGTAWGRNTQPIKQGKNGLERG